MRPMKIKPPLISRKLSIVQTWLRSRTGWLACWLALLAWTWVKAAETASPPSAMIIENGQYADAPAARAAWQPMAGSPPAAVTNLDGGNLLRLLCPFEGSKLERVAWDRAVSLDLSGCQGVEFQLYCADPKPISYFAVYFQSGNGWYNLSFFPETAGWCKINLDKAQSVIEGKPTGWHAIQAIRISAWRGGNQSTEFSLRNMRQTGVLGVDTLAVLIRPDSKGFKESAGSREYAATVAKHLESLGISFIVLSESNLLANTLRSARLAISPDSSAISEATADTLGDYVKNGGRVLSFFGLPERLRPLVHIETKGYLAADRTNAFAAMKFNPALPGAPELMRQNSWNIIEPKAVPGASVELAQWQDANGQPSGHAAVVASTNAIEVSHVLLKSDPENQKRMLLAMATRLVPEIGRQAATATMARIGRLANYHDFQECSAMIEKSGQAPAIAKLAEARGLRETAEKQLAAGRYCDAFTVADQAAQRMLEAFATAQKPLAGEFRAFWCHSAFGVTGMTWDQAIQRLAENGFTAILPNMLWGGLAYYPSDVLPEAAEVAAKGDQIAECLAACKKYGVQAHIWKVNWNSSHAPKQFLDRMRSEKRLQHDSQGKEEPWLCPSHPDNQQMEIDSMVEIVKRYEVDGIHFDYIRYPDADHCFCDGCRERFAKAKNLTIEKWPADVMKDGPHRPAWLDWRRDNITRVVRTVSEQARAIKPKIKISAAVFPNWAVDRDNIGQDWSLWCQKGYLDFVCPMDYTASDAQLENWVRQQKAWAGTTPYYPGLGAFIMSPDRVIGQIEITRRQQTKGFVIFNYDPHTANDYVPLMGQGITKK